MPSNKSSTSRCIRAASSGSCAVKKNCSDLLSGEPRFCQRFAHSRLRKLAASGARRLGRRKPRTGFDLVVEPWNAGVDASVYAVFSNRPRKTRGLHEPGGTPSLRCTCGSGCGAGRNVAATLEEDDLMSSDTHQKVTASHLKRDAYLYVRQSTLRQVFENTESTKRQYGLRQRAVALGWPQDHIVVIDTDLGESGASTDREGFQQLVTAVSMGQAGIVLGLEVSRLARNSTVWHRLLEICALTDTLILDEDGVYDPAHFNDRLLLGLKGTMSEAELHVLSARLRGGILNKAKRGELIVRPPIGFVYSEGHLVLDPDQQIQQALRMLFEVFRRTGSALATVRNFRQQGLLFPRRIHCGPNRGEIK